MKFKKQRHETRKKSKPFNDKKNHRIEKKKENLTEKLH